VIELEDDRIVFPAPDARMLAKKRHDERAIRSALVRVVPLTPLSIRLLVLLIVT